SRGVCFEKNSRRHVGKLDRSQTQKIMRDAPRFFRCSANELMLTTLARALTENLGRSTIVIDMEGHGREPIDDEVDLTRSIGWFTTMYPFVLDYYEDGGIAANIRATKRRIREIPSKGLGYGISKYFGSADAGIAPAGNEGVDIVFNFLGDLDQLVKHSEIFMFSSLSTEPWRDPETTRSHEVEISAFVENGQLKTWWIYDKDAHTPEIIHQLEQSFHSTLGEVILDMNRGDAVLPDVHDFPLAKLTEDELEPLSRLYPDIEDIYTVSPIQALHLSLADSDPGMGVDQWYLRLSGDIDCARLQRAWNSVLRRHSMLRSSFVYDNVSEPHAIIHSDVQVFVEEEDWSGHSAAEVESRLGDFLADRKQQGLDVSKAPLTRLALIRLSGGSSILVWTNHHLQLDGWSWPLVLADVGRSYANDTDAEAEPPAQYSDFVQWLRLVDKESDRRFWTSKLEHFSRPNRLPGADKADIGSDQKRRGYEEYSVAFSIDQTQNVDQFCRALDATLTNLVFTTWALILSRVNNSDSVMFGAAFSGRPADLDGVETIVGPFVNDLPICVDVNSTDSARQLVTRVRETQAQMTEHQQTPLEAIHECSAIPWRFRLFDSLVVVQNYQQGRTRDAFGKDITLDDIVGNVRTNYPLSIVVSPAEEMEVTITARSGEFRAGAVAQIADLFKSVLMDIVGDPSRTCAEIPGRIPPELMSLPSSGPVRTASPIELESGKLSETERKLIEIWRNEFQVTDIGINDSWAEFDVQSALIIRVHRRINEKFGTNFSIAKIYEFPTIRAFADLLDTGQTPNALAHVESRARRARMANRQRNRSRLRGGIS
ncbi:MAG: condensation domain-containing protein, partial [Gammaproteobacteria bacterium]|nr:condensation domain-containing protein [Gammaproteobacteria bacterium]